MLKLGVLEIDMTYVSCVFVLKWQWNGNKNSSKLKYPISKANGFVLKKVSTLMS